MPVIASQAKKLNALFYWHLGDFRWMSDRDEDMRSKYLLEPPRSSWFPIPTYTGTGRNGMI
jgi:hypothetical protein